MTKGSLCSGIGGLDLLIPGEPQWFSEIDDGPCAVLDARFSGVPNIGSLLDTDWSSVAPVDILTAGYPCQPFSLAGRRLGEDDPRHLWPAVAKAVRHLGPGVVFLENVSGHRSKGFGVVIQELAEMGYGVRWTSVRSSDVGAPHRRERVFIAAHRHGQYEHGRWDIGQGRRHELADGRGLAAYARYNGCLGHSQLDGQAVAGVEGEHRGHVDGCAVEDARRPDMGKYEPAVQRWEQLTRPAPHPQDEKGRLNPAFVEWMMGYPKGWVTDVVDKRTASLKMLGNAVQPQSAALAWETLCAL